MCAGLVTRPGNNACTAQPSSLLRSQERTETRSTWSPSPRPTVWLPLMSQRVGLGKPFCNACFTWDHGIPPSFVLSVAYNCMQFRRLISFPVLTFEVFRSSHFIIHISESKWNRERVGRKLLFGRRRNLSLKGLGKNLLIL
jgi:hypothetical protein